MRSEKPEFLALFVALVIGGFTTILFLYINTQIEPQLSLNMVLFSTLLIMLVAFLLVRYSVQYFIYNKVKIIFKNIHALKVGNDKDEVDVARSSDLDAVSREVAEWAEQRQAEILELQERETFRREFIGNVSHELKTPVFNIQGYLLTLLDGALDDPDINRKYLKRANKSVDRMINIIEDLDVISNLEAKRVQLVTSTFDLVLLVKEVFEFLEEQAEKKKTRLKLHNEFEKPIKVEADRSKIEQVLVNLISNAIKYGRKKGVVEVRFFDMHDQLLTEVSDDGIGIPEEDISRIFERFYRVDKSRSRDAGGTGLGLAIVKHIMEAHKGTINARSSEDSGSTFSFTLKKA